MTLLMESFLKNIKDKYSEMINFLPYNLIIHDFEGNLLYGNKIILKTLKYGKKEFLNLNIKNIINKNSYSNFRKFVKKTLNSNKSTYLSKYLIELEFLTKKGEEIYVESWSFLLRHHNKSIAILTIARNISDQKRYIAQLTELEFYKTVSHKKTITMLEKSKEMAQTFIDSVPNLYFYWKNENLKYIGCNQNFANYMGLGVDQVIGKKNISLSWNINDLDFLYKKEKNILEKKKPIFYSDEKYIAPNGTENWFTVNRIPLLDSKNKIIGIIVSLIDITDKINFEHQLKILNRELEKKVKERTAELKQSEERYRDAYNLANFYKDLFAHDIGNILNNIGLSNELSLKYLENPKKAKNMIDVIKEQLARGVKLINNVQKLSIINETEITLETLDASKILKDAIEFIDKSHQNKRINIVIDAQDENYLVQANELLLDVFENLLNNGIKYNNASSVEILVKISKERKDGTNYVKMQFIDNGIGVSDNKKKIIFQKGSKKLKGAKGMGFGLSIVKKIIDSYNGQIWVENRVREDYTKGSNFSIIIPAF